MLLIGGFDQEDFVLRRKSYNYTRNQMTYVADWWIRSGRFRDSVNWKHFTEWVGYCLAYNGVRDCVENRSALRGRGRPIVGFSRST